jgi:hypothetical protein
LLLLDTLSLSKATAVIAIVVERRKIIFLISLVD